MKARFGLEGTLLNDTGAAGVATGATPTTALFDREATVGLSGAFGSIDLGRQNILGIGSVGLADPLGLAFAATSPNVLFGGMNNSAVYGAYGANGSGSALRQSNSVKYVSPTFSGFGFAVMRAFGEQGAGIQKNSYQGASMFYNEGPFGMAGAYARMKNSLDSDLLTSYGVGLKYAIPQFTVKGTYIANKLESNGRKIAVFGVGVDVPVAPALTLTGAAYNTKRTGDARDDSQQYHAIAKYALSKRTIAYAAYSHASTDAVVTATGINLAQGFVAVGSDNANRFTTGVMHMF
jgi:predicted porin